MGWLVEGILDLPLISAALDRQLAEWLKLSLDDRDVQYQRLDHLSVTLPIQKTRYQIRSRIRKNTQAVPSYQASPWHPSHTFPLSLSLPFPHPHQLHCSSTAPLLSHRLHGHPDSTLSLLARYMMARTTPALELRSRTACSTAWISRFLYMRPIIASMPRCSDMNERLHPPLHEGLNVNVLQGSLIVALDQSSGLGKPESRDALVTYRGVTVVIAWMAIIFMLWYL